VKQRTQQDPDDDAEGTATIVGLINEVADDYRATTREQDKRLDKVERDVSTIADAVQRGKLRNIAPDKLGTGGASDDDGIVTLGWDRDGEPVKAYTPKAKLAREKSEHGGVGRLVKRYVVGGQAEADASKAMSGAQATAGGLLLPSSFGAEILDAVRAEAACIGAGALTVPMGTREVTLARLASDPVSTWRPESAAIPSTDPNFVAAVLRAKTLATIIRIPVELFEDAANLESFLMQVLASSFAVELDRAAINGSGEGAEPLGILGSAGIQTITSVGTIADFDDPSTASEMLAIKSALPTAMVAHPSTFGKYDRLKEATTNAPLRPPDSWRAIGLHLGTVGCPVASAIVADFSSLVIGMRTEIRIEASRDAADSSGSAFSNLQIWLRAYMRCDVVLTRPERFVALTGITA
jgi:HK97 family phage major capsid protein